jgi:hypothetical protein
MSARQAWPAPEGGPRTVRRLREGQLFESTGRGVGQRGGFVLVSWDTDGPMTPDLAADLTWLTGTGPPGQPG